MKKKEAGPFSPTKPPRTRHPTALSGPCPTASSPLRPFGFHARWRPAPAGSFPRRPGAAGRRATPLEATPKRTAQRKTRIWKLGAWSPTRTARTPGKRPEKRHKRPGGKLEAGLWEAGWKMARGHIDGREGVKNMETAKKNRLDRDRVSILGTHFLPISLQSVRQMPES